MTVVLAVTIDTECDKGPGWRVRQPLSFRNVLEGVPARLQPLFERYGVKPTYLLSPEVLADDACAALFRGLDARAELGTHLHSEFIEPESAMDSRDTKSFLGEYAPAVQRAKLANLTDLFEARIGYRPTAFRAGRFALSPHTLGFLEELGYRVDSSVTPYTWWWRRRGEGVNFLGAPDQPYHPSRGDVRKAGTMRILEVPVTLVNPFWERFPAGLLRALDPLRRWQTIGLNTLVRGRLECRWLRPTYASAEEMLAVARHVIARANRERAVLCMMFHSNEVTPGMSPYNATAAEVEAFLARLERFLDAFCERQRVRFAGLSEIAEAPA